MNATTTAPPDNSATTARPRALLRSRPDRMIAGVAAGVARYCGIDPLIVRIAFAALVVVGGAGLPLYLACWLLIPDEGSGRSIAADVTSGLQDWKS